MLEKQSFEVQEEFSVELLGFLTEEQLLIWEMDKTIDSYIGGELKLLRMLPKLHPGLLKTI